MKFTTPTARLQLRPDDPAWYFLAEYSLNELIPKNETGGALRAGSLFQIIRDLDIPGECLKRIETALTEFAKQTQAYKLQDNCVFPIVIRLFYGGKAIKLENPDKPPSDSHAKHTFEPVMVIRPDIKNEYGGWGFFIIERGHDFPPNFAAGSPKFICLYLYREGE